MVVFKQSGNFNSTERFFKNAQKLNLTNILNSYGQKGVNALALATPVDSGLTASSWGYEINISRSFCSLTWTNSNVIDGTPIAIIIQYGHATRNGGYVQGRDYINPALKPIFDDLASEIWKEVTSL